MIRTVYTSILVIITLLVLSSLSPLVIIVSAVRLNREGDFVCKSQIVNVLNISLGALLTLRNS